MAALDGAFYDYVTQAKYDLSEQEIVDCIGPNSCK
eukprot:gene13320-15660_t